MGLEGVMDQSEARESHLAPDILEPPHLAHGHHGRQAGHRVDGELGECSHLKINKLNYFIFISFTYFCSKTPQINVSVTKIGKHCN